VFYPPKGNFPSQDGCRDLHVSQDRKIKIVSGIQFRTARKPSPICYKSKRNIWEIDIAPIAGHRTRCGDQSRECEAVFPSCASPQGSKIV